MAPRNLESSDWQVNYPRVRMRSAHLRRSREWADCSFRFDSDPGAGGTILEAHRLILAMASPVFAAMFYGNVGDKEGPIHISDIDQQIFSSLLDYIYTDEVNINRTEVAINLFGAANKYILVHLEKRCINYLLENLTPQNVCHVYEFSCLFNEDVLKHKCLEMFSTQTLDVIKGCSFKEAQLETVGIIYSLESLDIESELDLFNALIEYTESRETTDDRSTGVESELNKEASEMNAGVPSADVTMNDKRTSAEELSASDSSTTDIAKKRNTARKTVSIVMEQIRFLTLTPTEFAECKNLSHLLSDAEILVLSMNISSLKTNYPLPAGLSTIRLPRNKTPCKKNSTWTERITIKNISKLKSYESKVFCVGDIPWVVKVEPFFKINNLGKGAKRLLVKIVCLLDLNDECKQDEPTWMLNTQLAISIIPFSINGVNKGKIMSSGNGIITRKAFYQQTSFSWLVLTDPAYGVIRDDDSLILEVFLAQDQLIISKEEMQVNQDEDEDL